MANNAILTKQIFNSTVVSGGYSVRSEIFDLSDYKPELVASLHVTDLTGTGKLKFEYELSNSYDPAAGYNQFIIPSDADDIKTSMTNTSGDNTARLTYITFTTGGTAEVAGQDLIWGASSGASAIVESVTLSSGTWAAGTAAGLLNIVDINGTFNASETINVSGKQDNICSLGTDAASPTAVSGRDMIDFGPEPCKAMRIKVTETTGAAATLTAHLMIQ